MYLKEVRPYFHQCNVYTSFNVFLKKTQAWWRLHRVDARSCILYIKLCSIVIYLFIILQFNTTGRIILKLKRTKIKPPVTFSRRHQGTPGSACAPRSQAMPVKCRWIQSPRVTDLSTRAIWDQGAQLQDSLRKQSSSAYDKIITAHEYTFQINRT
jgi:hypothetical protein